MYKLKNDSINFEILVDQAFVVTSNMYKVVLKHGHLIDEIFSAYGGESRDSSPTFADNNVWMIPKLLLATSNMEKLQNVDRLFIKTISHLNVSWRQMTSYFAIITRYSKALQQYLQKTIGLKFLCAYTKYVK